jgi:hypothetical protein
VIYDLCAVEWRRMPYGAIKANIGGTVTFSCKSRGVQATALYPKCYNSRNTRLSATFIER